MTLTVAIIAPGNMGAGVARRLAGNGLTVLTMLAGRSTASVARAREASMKDVGERELLEADFLLSILPPGEALNLAKRLATLLAATNRKPTYVDCNAVSPATMAAIADVVMAAGAPFAAAGIVGPPPKPGSMNTKFYVSGPAAAAFARFNEHGLIVRVLEGPLTAASALKMSYAGITKGFTALGATMMLAATRAGVADALKAELVESQSALLGFLGRQTPSMYGKAYRWVAELDEIASFVGADFPEHDMLAAAGCFYQRIAKDFDGDKDEIAALDAFLRR